MPDSHMQTSSRQLGWRVELERGQIWQPYGLPGGKFTWREMTVVAMGAVWGVAGVDQAEVKVAGGEDW